MNTAKKNTATQVADPNNVFYIVNSHADECRRAREWAERAARRAAAQRARRRVRRRIAALCYLGAGLAGALVGWLVMG